MKYISIITTAFAILKFLAVELPRFLDIWHRFRRNIKYKSAKEKIEAALEAYRLEPSIEKLKKLEESQK
jgi:hypothetical protein